MISGLDHIQLAAPPGCEAAARRFFGELLGLREIDKPEALRSRGGVWFAVGAGAQLHVGVTDAFTPARKAHPALRVAPDALDALADRLQAAAVGVTWDTSVPEMRRFFCDDPWGNRIELIAG